MSIYEGHGVTLHHGDCLDVLRSLPDCSVDAVICDPPYGLANTDPAHVVEALTRWSQGDRDFIPSGRGFMGKEWDAFVPPPAVWDECARILKPGGHLLAFAGSRTFDLMALSIRFAGFEIRDSIAWLYGSGFPKSLDVSKAIDKRRDWSLVERLSGEIRRARAEAGLSLAEIGQATLGATGGTYGKWYHRGGHMFFETGRSLPSRPEWEHLRHVLPIAPEFTEVYAEAERQKIGVKAGNRLAVAPGQGEDRSAIDLDVTTHATPDAERWQGWGTALKPAFEPVVVARKPLAGTVAANVLAHGTGALNIDGCRNALRDDEDADALTARSGGVRGFAGQYVGGTAKGAPPTDLSKGRWPANVVLDESQAAALDEQSGESRDGVAVNRNKDPRAEKPHEVYGGGWLNGDLPDRTYGGAGGASRFFYVAKADASERPRYKREGGSDNATTYGQMKKRECNVCGNRTCPAGGEQSGKPWPTCGHDDWSWVEQQSARDEFVAHPTVKPLSLMRWLVRLVTPPGGTVLEPFAGSGTTVEACIVEGFQCIAIEREADYLPLIRQRIARRRDPVEALRGQAADLGLFDLLGGEGA